MSKLEEYVIKHSSCSMPRCEYVENGIEIDCDTCQGKMLKEHDNQIRTDAIEECISIVDGCLTSLPVIHDKVINALCRLKEKKNDD